MARPDFTLIWGDNSAPFTAISDSDYQDGWSFRAGLPPKRVNFDYFQNLSDSRSVWLGDQAVLAVGHEWQSDIAYDANAYVRPVGGGALYKSLSGSNTGNEPTVSPASWELITLENFVAASTTVAGKVELATNTEAQTGSDTTRAVTPAALASVTGTTTRAGLLELATNTETITGTDTARAVTPANITALTAAGRITSGEKSIVLGTQVSEAHGFGAVPYNYRAKLICKITEHGYSVGQVVSANIAFKNDGTANTNPSGLQVWADSTNIYAVPGTFGLTILTTTGGYAVITPTNWRILLQAEK